MAGWTQREKREAQRADKAKHRAQHKGMKRRGASLPGPRELVKARLSRGASKHE